MASVFGRSDLPVRNNAASRFIQWLVMVLVFMAAIAVTVNTYTDTLLSHWNRSVSGTLTVQIPPPPEAKPGDAKAADASRDVMAVLGVLKVQGGVVSAKVVPRVKVLELLEPWLGAGEAVNDLPLPALIDVELKPDADTRVVADAVTKSVPAALVDDHRVWLSRVTNLAEGVGLIALVLMAMIAMALGLTVIFATRASMAEFHQIIEVLHLVGARDTYIAGQFARRALAQGLIGGVLGLIIFAPAMALIAWLGARVDQGVLPEVTVPLTYWLILACLPAIAGVLSMMTAHITVRRALQTMP